MRFEKLAPFLDERMRRLVAASESLAIGFGGTSQVSRQTGVSRRAMIRGIKELDEAPSVQGGRVRRPGGGRKRTVDKDASLKTDLERLVDPVTRGDPESPLRWTCKSVRKLAEELNRLGHQTSHRMVAELLPELGYSLQGQPQDPGRVQPCRPRPAIPAHQPACHRVSPAAAARHFSRYQEERVAGQFQESWRGTAPQRRPGTSARA